MNYTQHSRGDRLVGAYGEGFYVLLMGGMMILARRHKRETVVELFGHNHRSGASIINT